MKAGKLTPHQASKWAPRQSPEALASYLKHATPVVASTDDPITAAASDDATELAAATGVTPAMAKMWTSQGHKPEDFARLLAQYNADQKHNARVRGNGVAK